MLKRPWLKTLVVLPLTPISSRERNTLNFEAGSSIGAGGGDGTPLYWLYTNSMVLQPFWTKIGYRFCPF